MNGQTSMVAFRVRLAIGGYAQAIIASADDRVGDTVQPSTLSVGQLMNLIRRALLRFAAEGRNTGRASDFARKSWKLIQERRWKDATFFAEAAVAADPEWSHGYRMLALALEGSGNFEMARDALERGLKAAPADPDILEEFGNLLMKTRQYAAAEETYRRALEVRPNRQETLRMLGRALEAQVKLTDAANVLQHARQLSPSDHRVLAALGEVECQQRHWEEANTLLESAIRLGSTSPLSHYYRAYALAALGKTAEALNVLQVALTIDPSNPTFRKLKAELKTV